VSTGSSVPSAPVAWHELECGSYAADLELWAELAERAGGPVLEIGAGTGRVTIDLARSGRRVIAVERDPELAARLAARIAADELPVEVVEADARALAADRLGSRVPLAIGPMHVIQAVDAEPRRELLAAAARCLAPGGTLALAVVDESYLDDPAAAAVPPIPDMREIDGVVFSSEPLWVQVSPRAFTVRRLRRRVDPGGELQSEIHDDVLYRVSPRELEEEASGAGLRPAGRRGVGSARGEADSIVVILEAQ
jgi:SAM-dependent methyltransferase